MKNIVLFGAGRSSGSLIEYLIIESVKNDWQLIVADSNLEAAILKTENAPHTRALSVNVRNDAERKVVVQEADIVISMLPPALHLLVALDCVEFRKNLLTASYTDQSIRDLEPRILERGLFFLYEMGLDPGIDHMSAMQLINRIKSEKGKISAFKSHTGGLVAPESDDNPWHYKISWNPRNVVLAGAAGASYKENNEVKNLDYSRIFENCKIVNISGAGQLAYYPNRDSLSYIPVYSLKESSTFIRTTLRHPSYCDCWNQLVKARLTDEKKWIRSAGLTFKSWSEPLLPFVNNENFECLNYLGLFDDTPVPDTAANSADILQYLMVKKLAMKSTDKDRIVMSHEIEYKTDEASIEIRSNLIVNGDNSQKTAMAKTVGLPLGIATKLILQKKMSLTGLHIPILPEIYEPVLKELEDHGIRFEEKIS
jgi:saccharopine dehydrogenase-like NADP-dependent oxidoreductase